MPPPPVETVPSRKRRGVTGPAIPADWQGRLLEYYRTHGGLHRAAEAASVSLETVRRHRHANPAFDAAVREAREYYADLVEERMMAIGERRDDVTASIVRLKALRPQEYIEKHAVMNVTVT